MGWGARAANRGVQHQWRCDEIAHVIQSLKGAQILKASGRECSGGPSHLVSGFTELALEFGGSGSKMTWGSNCGSQRNVELL